MQGKDKTVTLEFSTIYQEMPPKMRDALATHPLLHCKWSAIIIKREACKVNIL